MSDFIRVDEWDMKEEDMVVRYDGKLIIVPFDKIFNQSSKLLNNFIIKRDAYVGQLPIIVKYINYFYKFYDTNDELILAYLKLKYIIDNKVSGVKKPKQFIKMLYSILFTPKIIKKIDQMVEENYYVDVESSSKKTTGKNYSPDMVYTNYHAKMLLKISLAMKLLVPAAFHFINSRNIEKTDILFLIYRPLFDIFGDCGDYNIYDKLYLTTTSKVNSSVNRDGTMWDQREIMGEDPITFIDTLFKDKFICDSLFKYNFSNNIISFNAMIFENQLGYFIRQSYDYNQKEVSRDKISEESLSTLDKLEMSSAKLDETTVILSRVNIKNTIKRLRKKMSIDIPKEEIAYYRKNHDINKFQSQLVLYFYAKYFGGFGDLNMLTRKQYTILLILLKRRLQLFGSESLAHLLTANVETKINARTIQNNKFLSKIESSDLYMTILTQKYSTLEELAKANLILNILSTLINTRFTFVDFDHPDKLGTIIELNQDIICDEFLNFVNQF